MVLTSPMTQVDDKKSERPDIKTEAHIHLVWSSIDPHTDPVAFSNMQQVTEYFENVNGIILEDRRMGIAMCTQAFTVGVELITFLPNDEDFIAGYIEAYEPEEDHFGVIQTMPEEDQHIISVIHDWAELNDENKFIFIFQEPKPKDE